MNFKKQELYDSALYYHFKSLKTKMAVLGPNNQGLARTLTDIANDYFSTNFYISCEIIISCLKIWYY
jgi:hypothetical protein